VSGSTRMPYGMAKRIVATMAVGDTIVVRPQWVVPFHNAARRMGARLAAVSFRRDGMTLFRMLRIEGNWQSGHIMARLPRREQVTGRWLRKDAA
jgi:hypothetical protein